MSEAYRRHETTGPHRRTASAPASVTSRTHAVH
ncbi:hypothetical protein Rrhod_2931 [Rhodococcus rhodnii LMG 5362]|uniref:Uncharacterized protein n=1 Tax=Rhodococcus rhodnii LMG 5362 TaxID=1273125 RepID=R7WK08_9NOCA|nr:hypothetical protein Rrhod_2931 [Rhodococcus rhodnii LMG 5362]